MPSKELKMRKEQLEEKNEWFNDILVRSRQHADYFNASFGLEAAEELCMLMEKAGMTRSELSKASGVSKKKIKKFLRGYDISYFDLTALFFVFDKYLVFKIVDISLSE